MPERKGDQPGKLQESSSARRIRRQQQRVKREQEVYSDKWPSSKYASESEIMSTEDDVDYITFDIRYCVDPQYVADGMLKADELGHKSGHWDEVVAAQQTAYDNYIQDLFEFLTNFPPMYVIHDFLKSFPTSTTANLTLGDGQTGNVTVPLLKKTTISDYLADFKNAELFIPKFVSYVIKTLMGTVWQLNSEWFSGGIAIPGRYYYNFVPAIGTTSLDTLIANLKSNSVLASRYMNQFGIPGDQLDMKLFEYEVVKADPQNPKYIAWFGEMPFCVYHDAAVNYKYPAYPLTGTHTGHRFWHKAGGGMNDTEFYDISRLLIPRNATYNKYGGLFAVSTGTTDGYCSLLRADEPESSELITGTTMGAEGYMDIISRYDALYRATDTMNLSLTGTKVTENDLALNMHAIKNDWKFRSSISHTYADGVLVRTMIEKTGYTSKAKDAPAVAR